jgi:hypothetical protein
MNRIALAIATGIGALTLASACHATPSTPLIPTVPAPAAHAERCTLTGPLTFDCGGNSVTADYDHNGWSIDGVRQSAYCASEDSCAIAWRNDHAVVIHVIP